MAAEEAGARFPGLPTNLPRYGGPALRGVARALRCAKLRVLREHLVLPLGGAHLLRLVEGRAAARLLRGQGGETAPQRHRLRCMPVQHSAAW